VVVQVFNYWPDSPIFSLAKIAKITCLQKFHVLQYFLSYFVRVSDKSKRVHKVVHAVVFRLSAATLRMAGSLQKSAEIMKCMQELVKVSDVAASMREMSREMMKVYMLLYVLQ